MKICLDLDDFSVVNNRMELLLKMKREIPQFKVSMFTIPTDIKTDVGPYLIRKELLSIIKDNLDWIQIIPHGYLHNGREMRKMNYQTMKETMDKIEKAFDHDGLSFERGFKAPHWSWNTDVVRALDDAGWWGAIDPRQPNMSSTKRFYKYSDSIDAIEYSKDVLKLHGHIYGTRNDFGKCFNNLLTQNIREAEWVFVTDFIEEKI